MLPPLSKVKGTERDALVLPTAVVGSFCGARTISFTALLPIVCDEDVAAPVHRHAHRDC